MKYSLIKIGFRVVFYSILAVLFLMIGYAHLHRFFGNSQDKIPAALQDIRKISHALRAYAAKNDVFPYDSRGSQFALYKLKPYLNGFPSSLPKEFWDDENKILRALPYDYLNTTNIELYADITNPSNNIVIIAEKIKPDIKGINLVALNGAVLWYQPQGVTIQEIGPVVGKRLTELRSPNWKPWGQPPK